MKAGWSEQLISIRESLLLLLPELVLLASFVAILIAGMLRVRPVVIFGLGLLTFLATTAILIVGGIENQATAFNGMLQIDGLSSFLKILLNVAGAFTCLFYVNHPIQHRSEFFSLLVIVVLGGHFLLMSKNLLMVFLAIEMISIPSYVLAGFAFNKEGSEGSMKYFLFGAAASAIMLYGFSILYGITGTLDFSSQQFFDRLLHSTTALTTAAALMALVGLLYKISAAPMHLWAPDVYQAAPIPVMAFFSVVPKLAGFGVLIRFILSVNLFGQSVVDWQMIIAVVAIATITIGNFSALQQNNARRMMAYSSIAHSGFMLVGVAAFLPQGIHFMIFYAAVYLIMNYLIFMYLQYFEDAGIDSIPKFAGQGRPFAWPSVLLLIGLISLTGLPPTAGFTGKLLVFSSLWQAFQETDKSILLWLFIFGLLNTVISLFYYLRIPYYLFLKPGEPLKRQKLNPSVNFFGLILVLALLSLFFKPALLMGWINKITFVL